MKTIAGEYFGSKFNYKETLKCLMIIKVIYKFRWR